VIVITAATVLLAGIYQFTPLKYRWRGRESHGEAFRLGAAHGLFCVGCPWSLIVGVGSLV
jgi:predicted metal-binding membrane protein